MIQIGFLEEGQYFDEAQEKLNEVEQLLSDASVDQRGLYYYWQGHLYYKKEDYREALKTFQVNPLPPFIWGARSHARAQKLVEIGDQLQDEKWVLTYTELESVDILQKRNNPDKAQLVLDSAKKRSGYDFEKNCSMRIKKLQSKLQREAKTKQ